MTVSKLNLLKNLIIEDQLEINKDKRHRNSQKRQSSHIDNTDGVKTNGEKGTESYQ